MHRYPSACLLLLATASFQSTCARESRLSEMFSESATQSWGQLHLDQSVGGTPLAIAGRKFTHGLGTHANSTIRYDLADSFMQRHLHMGCFPTAPYPANNHCINPEPGADRLYQEYGPLLDALRGKRWVLAPHCVETVTPGVKVNLFEVPGGYALPVTFGGPAATATIRVRGLVGMDKFTAEAIHPGVAEPVRLAATASAGTLEIALPLNRGYAMIRLQSH